MTVADLIKSLAGFPFDAEVYSVWDGSARTKIDVAWLAQGREDPLDGGAQRVLLAGDDDVVYDEDNMPENAIRETSVSRNWYASQLTK